MAYVINQHVEKRAQQIAMHQRKVGDEKLEQTATECTPAESIRYADTLVNYDCFAVGRYMLYAPHRVDRTAPAVHFACRWYRQAQPTGSTVGVVNDSRAKEIICDTKERRK